MRPTPLLVRSYLSRGALCWLGTRALASVLLSFAGLNAIRVSAGAIVDVVLVSVGLSYLATVRRAEGTLLGNLAIHPLWIGIAFAAPAMIGEAAVRAAANILS